MRVFPWWMQSLRKLWSCSIIFLHTACDVKWMESAKEHGPHQAEAPVCCYSLSSISQKQRRREGNSRFNSPVSLTITTTEWTSDTHTTGTRWLDPPELSPRHDAFPSICPQTPITGTQSLTDMWRKKKECFTGMAEVHSANSAPSFWDRSGCQKFWAVQGYL